MPGVEAGQRFPFVNLEKALERAQKLYDANPRGGELAVSTAFEVWGYSAKSSGGFQTISALKMYGLLVKSASEARSVQLTPEAQNYFRDERETERAKLLQKLAINPPLLRALWEDWGAQPPSDVAARSELKVKRQFTEQASRTVLGIYKDNLALAKLTGGAKVLEPGSGQNRNDEGKRPKVGDFVQWTSAGVDQFSPPRRVTRISDDGSHLWVLGSITGIPMEQVTVTDPPAPPKPPNMSLSGHASGNSDINDINVLFTGGRLQITADIDAKGIKKLKRMLDMHLELMTGDDE